MPGVAVESEILEELSRKMENDISAKIAHQEVLNDPGSTQEQRRRAQYHIGRLDTSIRRFSSQIEELRMAGGI